MKRNQF